MGMTGRMVLGVIAGVVLWAVLWVGGTSVARLALPELLDPAQRLEHVGALLGFVVYSVLLSLAAGWTAAAVARAGRGAMRAVWVLAAIQLAIGIAVEASYWALMPVWYHLVFLALLVPATVAGGRLRVNRRAGAGTHAPLTG